MSIERLKEIWPEWKIVGELGKGAFGTVYKAVDEEAGFKAYSAIKVLSVPSSESEISALRAEGMSRAESKSYLKEIVDDFANEIKLMHELKGASNIVGVEQFKILERTDSIGWDIFIRMELLRPFTQYLEEHTLTEDEIIKLGVDICTALEVCDKMNIIHRDIKPANIFLDRFGSFKLGDFGIAKELEKTKGAASVKGTFNFMAPEVAKGDRYDSTVDIYSLGLVLYSLCNNGCPPFVNAGEGYSKRKEAIDRRMAGHALPPPVKASENLANIILTACAFDPKRRFRSPTVLKNALMSCRLGVNIQPPIIPNISVSDINQTVSVRKSNAGEYSVAVRDTDAHALPAEESNNNQQKSKQKKSAKGIIALLIAVALIVTGFGVYTFVPFWKTTDDGLKWDLKYGTLRITGDGKMMDYDDSSNTVTHASLLFWSFKVNNNSVKHAPWLSWSGVVKKIIIEDGVISIGEGAFSGCSSLISITIPDSVTRIGSSSFYQCDSLTSVTIPDSVTWIGNEAFFSCDSLTSITIPDSVIRIGNRTFYGCSSLASITIPDSVTWIVDDAFYGCDNLTIRCSAGSYAEEYAKSYHINYVTE